MLCPFRHGLVLSFTLDGYRGGTSNFRIIAVKTLRHGYVSPMTSSDGFWSYVQNDNAASFDKIVALGRDLQMVYQMRSGTEVNLFIDRDSLEWGDAWKSVIESNLGTVAFFIPIITPAFFNSPACRSELESFAERTNAEGLQGLLLPILWVPVEGLEDESSLDPLVRIIQERQWEDWTDLRHVAPGSEGYSRRLEKMADRIMRANKEADEAEADRASGAVADERGVASEDGEGRLDVLARMEEDMNAWAPLMGEVAVGLQDMGAIADETTAEMTNNPRAKTFAGRLSVVRESAKRLQEPADRIEESGSQFALMVSSVDQGVRIIIDSAPAEVADDADAREQFENFFNQIRGLAVTTTTVDEQLSGFVRSIAPLQKQSRDLKKPMQAATNGVTRIRTALAIIGDWIDLIDDIDWDSTGPEDA
jgi:hypothetical protein